VGEVGRMQLLGLGGHRTGRRVEQLKDIWREERRDRALVPGDRHAYKFTR
jgi:hypothetical protein